jgi:hypothetical protein
LTHADARRASADLSPLAQFFRHMDDTEGEDVAIGADREIEGVENGRREREQREAVKA